MDEYDYVIVGAGSAGCVLAARLSEEPGARVLLLEAGGEAWGIGTIADPRMWPANAKTDVDWGYDTEVEPGLGRSIVRERGKVIGGSSAINGMAFLRGDPTVYDAWANAGNPGWDFESVLPYFKRSETVPGRDRGFRGAEGPLRPGPIARPHPLARSFINACVEAGHSRTDDFNGARHDGVGLLDLNIVDGVRQSAADAYLTPAVRARPNLAIEPGTRVVRLLLESGRCAGVSVVADGVPRDIRAGEEVILSAGAISGTCRMGPGDDCVVDATLKVHGLEALRIADASIMPTIPDANTHATVVMIGEKAADLVRAPAARPPASGSRAPLRVA